jgi:hypothetical protein
VFFSTVGANATTFMLMELPISKVENEYFWLYQ